MKKPRMVLFDYGETLINNAPFDGLAASREMMKHVTKNPRKVTIEDLCEVSDRIFQNAQHCRDCGFEVHSHAMLRLTFESLELEFDQPLRAIEDIQFDFGSPGTVLPYVPEMLGYLSAHGYRTGVISNIGFSGESLTKRINRLLPDHQFEFILASSEYGVRKPLPDLFQLALYKAHLSAHEVWYCGDSPRFDIAGAASSGIFPVWYRGANIGLPAPINIDSMPQHLQIKDWSELTALLEHL